MTDKQKAAFLKREGWLRMTDDYYGWGDPKYDFGNRTTLENAYAIASRRKSARDTRRLKAAGWTYGDFACFVHEPAAMGWWHPKHPDRHTKSEALKLLEAPHEG